MRQKRIMEQWLSYRRDVIPGDAPQIQVDESRKAFYAGAAALLGTITKNLTPDHEPTAKDLTMMDEIAAELEEHMREVERGG